MSDPTIFALGIGMACIVSVVAVVHLHRPLRAILTDLCGTADRAAFWCAFSNITLFLMPLIFMLDYPPGANGGAWLWVLATVLKRGLMGLVISVVTLGIVIASFIRRCDVRVFSPQGGNS